LSLGRLVGIDFNFSVKFTLMQSRGNPSSGEISP
jgi:hypothetical protein